MKEFEYLAFYLSGHPLNQFLNKVSKLDIKNYEIKSNKNFHNEKNVLLAGTLLSKKKTFS